MSAAVRVGSSSPLPAVLSSRFVYTSFGTSGPGARLFPRSQNFRKLWSMSGGLVAVKLNGAERPSMDMNSGPPIFGPSSPPVPGVAAASALASDALALDVLASDVLASLGFAAASAAAEASAEPPELASAWSL